MKILQIVSGVGVNGAASYCLWLTRELVQRGHEVTLLCRPGAWVAQQLQPQRLHLAESELRRWPPIELRRIAAEIGRLGIEVIHTHMSSAHAFGVLLRIMTGTPCVATAHNRFLQLHWRFNDRVIAVSDAVARFHRRINLVPARRVETVHNFLDTIRLEEIFAASSAGVREHLGIGADEALIGYVGEVERRKGLIHLIKALPLILATVPRARLLVVGGSGRDRSYLKRARRTAEGSGVAERIVWAGFREDVPALLSSLDVFVLPSPSEHFSLALLEAMAASVPVVAAAAGGPAELIEAGRTGLLVPPRNPGALAQAVVDLLADPAQRLEIGSRGREAVRQRFSADTHLSRVEAILEEARGLRAGGRRGETAPRC
jgi:glycosyltransferase involved in cell wall biosynthesis